MSTDPLDYYPSRELTTTDILRMLILPVMVGLFGIVNLVFFPPPYRETEWIVARVIVPMVAVGLAEVVHWHIYRMTIYDLLKELLKQFGVEPPTG
jgi:hypothetical protein